MIDDEHPEFKQHQCSNAFARPGEPDLRLSPFWQRFGTTALLCLQHFTGTLGNWDPAVTDPLASTRDVILFDNAGIGRSTGTVPETVAEMARHALAFVDGLGIESCDVLGYSLGGMVAQQIVLDRPSVFRRMIPGRDGASWWRGHHAPGEAQPGPLTQRSE